MIRTETIGDATLYLGDCLEILPTLGRVDAVVTDPPYCSGSVSEASRTAAKGQGLRAENIAKLGWFVGDNMGTAGLASLLRSMAVRALDILNPEGSVLVFCDWRMVPNLAPTIESAGLRFQNMVVWDKGMMGLGMGFRAQHEIILHYTAGAPKYHNLGMANVIRTSRVSATEREHQTQKPVDLMEQLLSVVCCYGQTVVDPFMGSGSTGVAAIRRGVKFIGIERDREHFETACKRISEAWRQPRLFEEPKRKPEPAPSLFDGAQP
ncbi:COG0863 DNA modification methylase [uncultured Caudovirales phage]|uniref:COG0863 DNA modification methylase n=1 Tax=uncultured Caudovirales phage TaxID=2100421 RepID=A0A6J5M2L9_9CAUD|nr:COG0863 DNA modification methylase [uncultured Caudovirales phage]